MLKWDGLRIKRVVHDLGGVVVAALLIGMAPVQQGVEKRLAEPVPDCTTSRCHTPIRQHQHLHKPVAENQCKTCHEPKQGAAVFRAGPRHEFKRAGGKPDLCYACHDRVAVAPSAKGGPAKFIHQPVAMGVCVLCHDPHGADGANLLRIDVDRQLCVRCHRITFDQGDHVHPPVGDGACMACHDPHGSDQPKFLRAASPELCLDCHDGIEELLDSSTGTHGAITTGQSCIGCHNPHAGTYAGLLTKTYPKGPYFPYKEEGYTLCFDCHDQEMVEEEEDPDVTEFRNGDRNLHGLHVNRPGKGCTCGACHDPHAGGGPQHMADASRLGPQALLKQFTPSATGGTCLTKCHATWAYDRVKPIENQ